MNKNILLTLLLFSIASQIFAQADTITSANHKLQTQLLKEGTSTYLVYMTDSSMQKRTVGDVWIRTTSFMKKNNRDLVRFDWKWMRCDTVLAAIVNYCDRKTLAPFYHKADYKKRGIFAYDFKDGQMVPSDSIADNNAVKKGSVTLPIPVISWELDMETYPLLPIKKTGQIFDIAFFDPNEKEPSYHRYEVTGKEMLALNADTKISCWILRINYSEKDYAQFWLTEKSKEVIKVKEFYGGKYRFKVKQY